MSLGKPHFQKPSQPQRVPVVTGGLLRIVLLALVAVGGAVYALYLHYRPRPAPRPPATASAPRAPPSEIPIELSP